MILIEHNGEHLLVHDPKGYAGCTIVESDVDAAPVHALTHRTKAHRENGEWIIDKASHKASLRRASLRLMEHEKLVEEIVAEVLKRLGQ